MEGYSVDIRKRKSAKAQGHSKRRAGFPAAVVLSALSPHKHRCPCLSLGTFLLLVTQEGKQSALPTRNPHPS